jgi:TRAP-type C4-dicarboxylate transport system permease small subunit
VSKIDQAIKTLYDKIRPVANISNSISMVALAAIMFLTAVDVILRKVANMPIPGSYEVVQLLMATCVGLGLANSGLKKAHINIDLVITRLSRKVQGILGIITGVIALVVIGITTVQTCILITVRIASQLTSTVLYIPIFPFVIIVAFGFILYFVVLIIHFMEYLKEGTAK